MLNWFKFLAQSNIWERKRFQDFIQHRVGWMLDICWIGNIGIFFLGLKKFRERFCIQLSLLAIRGNPIIGNVAGNKVGFIWRRCLIIIFFSVPSCLEVFRFVCFFFFFFQVFFFFDPNFPPYITFIARYLRMQPRPQRDKVVVNENLLSPLQLCWKSKRMTHLEYFFISTALSFYVLTISFTLCYSFCHTSIILKPRWLPLSFHWYISIDAGSV